MEDLIRQYGEHLRIERNLSPHTLRNYLSDLRQFCQYLKAEEWCRGKEGREVAGRIDGRVIRGYLGILAKRCRKSSMGRKLAALKGFFRYLEKEEVIVRNPLSTFASPKQERPLPVFLSVDDVFRLLGGAQGVRPLEIRDRAVLEVFYSTGVRASELVGLNWSDVDFPLGIIKVTGKGSKERIVPIGDVALQALRD